MICTERESGVRISLTTPGEPRRRRGAAGFGEGAMAWFGTTMRSRLSATCREVSGVPSWKRTPSRSRKVQESPSRETVHVRARPGSMSLDPSRYCTMVSNTCREMKGTEPSIAVAGSRATGMDGSPTLRGTPCAAAKAGSARAASIASTTTPLRRSMTSLLISNACGHTSNAPSRGTGVHCFDSPLLPKQNLRLIAVLFVFQCQWHQTCLRTDESSNEPGSRRNRRGGAQVEGHESHRRSRKDQVEK